MTEWVRTLASPGARTVLYVRIVLLQLLWVGYVWLGMRRSGTSLHALTDTSPWTASRGFRLVGIGIAACLVWILIAGGLGTVLRPSPEQLAGLRAMLPHSGVERLWWSGFALSAGVCEELVYRGYLLRQFRALTHSALAALALQATAYALAHLVLPAPMIASVALLGLYLGALAVWQKSLVPGMIAHVGIGLAAVATPG
jgi:hypothetical protein